MLTPREYSPGFAKCVGFLSILLALFLGGVFLWDELPPRRDLEFASGKVSEVFARRGFVDFEFEGTSRVYRYNSKAGDFKRVREELVAAEGAEAALSCQAQDPLFGEEFCSVLELDLDQRSVRSYRQVAESWEEEAKFGPWVVSGFLIPGLALLWVAYRRPNLLNSKPPRP